MCWLFVATAGRVPCQPFMPVYYQMLGSIWGLAALLDWLRAVAKHASLEFRSDMTPGSQVVLMLQWMVLAMDVRLLPPLQCMACHAYNYYMCCSSVHADRQLVVSASHSLFRPVVSFAACVWSPIIFLWHAPSYGDKSGCEACVDAGAPLI